MSRTPVILAVLAALCVTTAVTPAQRPRDELLFTTLKPEQTLCPKPPSLRRIDPNDVMSVVPPTSVGPACRGADKWAPANAWCTLIGDENADGRIYEALFAGGHIDALQWAVKNKYPGTPSMRDMYISPKSPIGSNVSGAVADPGDAFRVQANGQFRKFLTVNQIRGAFNISSRTVNLDAITLAKHPKLGWFIYLSLENTHGVTVVNGGPMIAQDGAVLGLRVAALGEPVVLAPNPAYMVLTEAMMNALVTSSGVRNASGTPVTAIGDTDGLHWESSNQMFQNQFGVWNELMFSGERLTGGAVLTTAGGGSIAVLNGAPLASNVATTGVQVGLLPGPGAMVGSLNGLEVRPAELTHNFVLETPLPVIPAGGGVLRVDVGGASPAPGNVFLLVGVVAPGTPIVPFVPLGVPVSCFPEVLFPPTWFLPPAFLPVPVNAQGEGSAIFGLIPPPGADIYFQAWNWDPVSATVRLSTPITVE
jgi:hypothetical protein